MTPQQVQASYERTLRQHVHIRRYTGTGQSPAYFDVPTRARITNYASNELVGEITQGDRRAIVLTSDVAAGGIADLNTQDKLILNTHELAIMAVDDSTRSVDDTLIAYELQLRG